MKSGELLSIPAATRERVRAAILFLRAAGEKVTVRAAIARASPCSRTHVMLLLRLVKTGLDPEASWVQGPPPAARSSTPGQAAAGEDDDGQPEGCRRKLGRVVSEARTLTELQAAGLLVGEYLANRWLEPETANALQRLLAEQRQLVKARRLEEGETSPEHVAMVTEETLSLARDFEEIVDGRIRSQLRETVRVALEADRDWFPREVMADPERAGLILAKAGLDAFGDPVEAGEGAAHGDG